MKTIAFFAPAAFCAFLSILVLTNMLMRHNASTWMPAFYCFLPMCFVFGGIGMLSQHKELRCLRERLAALEQTKSV
jgi:hypothetical protein